MKKPKLRIVQKPRLRRVKERAQKVIDFIEKLTVPSGHGQGQPFVLQPWQKKFIREIYEPHDPRSGRRIVRRAILSMARKNGKTALIAAMALAHLVGPEAIPNGEIYSAANDRDQAAIIYKFARQIVESEPLLMAMIEIVASTKTMIGRPTGSIYRAVSAEAGTKHGYLPSMVIYDELAQAPNRELYDVLDTSFGARREPLFIIISTQSNDPEHVLSKLIDDGLSKVDPSIVCHLHAAAEDCALDDETQWRKANPGLGSIRDHDDLATAVAKATRLPAEESKVRNLFLNQRIAPIASLVSRREWMACAGSATFEEGEEVYLGLDLSSVVDLTALIVGSAGDQTKIMPLFFKPAELLQDHAARDFGGGYNRYAQWVDEGALLTSPGRSINPEVVALKIAELYSRFRVIGLAYDRWRIADLLRELDRIGLAAYQDKAETDGKINHRAAGLRLVPWGQGYRDMGPAIDAFEHEVIERTLVHPNNPVLNWNIGNAVATLDPAGNRKLDKDKSRFRIDGAVALAMLCGLKARDRKLVKLDVMAMIA